MADWETDNKKRYKHNLKLQWEELAKREVCQIEKAKRRKQEKPLQIPAQDWLQLPPAHLLQRPLTSQTTSAPYTASHNCHFWKIFLVEISEQLCVPPYLFFFFSIPKQTPTHNLKSIEGSYREKLIVSIGHYGKAVLCWCVHIQTSAWFLPVSEPCFFIELHMLLENLAVRVIITKIKTKPTTRKEKFWPSPINIFLIVFSSDVDAVDSHKLISYLYPLAEPSRAVTHDVFNCAEITANHNLKACCCFVFTLF